MIWVVWTYADMAKLSHVVSSFFQHLVCIFDPHRAAQLHFHAKYYSTLKTLLLSDNKQLYMCSNIS